MGVFEWMALIGAAAWLPQLGFVVYRSVITPRVVLIPVPELELGYTYFGPILNVKASLFAERKDAIILDMTVVLRHEHGREIVLEWHSFVEEFSELRDASGEATKVTRDQMATALRVSTAMPSEKFIRFQDPTFQDETRSLTRVAMEELERLKRAGSEEAVTEYLRSKENEALMSHFRHGLPWEAGRYEVTLRMQMLDRDEPAVAKSTFDLSQGEVDRIRKNIAATEERVRLVAEGKNADEADPYQWTNPRLQDKDVMIRK